VKAQVTGESRRHEQGTKGWDTQGDQDYATKMGRDWWGSRNGPGLMRGCRGAGKLFLREGLRPRRGHKDRDGYLCQIHGASASYRGQQVKGYVVAELILRLKLCYKMWVLYREREEMTNTCI